MPQVRPPFQPTRYISVDGTVTDNFRRAFSTFSQFYAPIAKFAADTLHVRPLADYAIREVHIVGSTLKGIDNSDLDLLMIADKIDWNDYQLLKVALSQALFNNRSKYSAIDVYVQPADDRPANPRWEVTSQIKPELDSLNLLLGHTR